MLEQHTIHTGKKLPGKSSISLWAKKSKISNFDKYYFLEGEKFKLKNPFAQEKIVSNREYRQYIFFGGEKIQNKKPICQKGQNQSFARKAVKYIAPAAKSNFTLSWKGCYTGGENLIVLLQIVTIFSGKNSKTKINLLLIQYCFREYIIESAGEKPLKEKIAFFGNQF